MNHKIVKCHTDQDTDQETSNEMFQEYNGTIQNNFKNQGLNHTLKAYLVNLQMEQKKQNSQDGGKRSDEAHIYKRWQSVI